MRTARNLIVLIVVILGLILVLGRGTVGATLESCSASVSPQTIATSQTGNFTVTLNNTGSNPILFFQVTMPSSNFSIQGKEASGWTGTSNSSMAQFWGGSLAAGASMNFTLTVQSGTSEVSAENWQVVANDVLSSDGTTACSGSLGVAISGVTDVTPPTLSDSITVSDVTANSVKVSWTTNENATSVVHYGLSGAYDLSKTQGKLSTSQVVTLDSLSANTTYGFYVVSTDSSGNATESSEGSFTTAKEGLTGTTVTVTNTVTTTQTKTETVVKIITDTTPPVLQIDELPEEGRTGKNVFAAAPLITGSADAEKALTKGAVKYIVKSEQEPKEVVAMVKEILAGYTRDEVPGGK